MPDAHGRRGPLPGAAHRLPVLRRTVTDAAAESVPDRKPPRAPAHLGKQGRAAWKALHARLPLYVEALDTPTIDRFCRLLDERAAWARVLDERGYIVTEPVVAPTGAVVGERVLPNPASKELRRIDRAIDSVSAALGVTPAARSRLGLELTTAERAAIDVDRVLAKKYDQGDHDA